MAAIALVSHWPTASHVAALGNGRARPVLMSTGFRACELCTHAVAGDGRLLCGRAAGQQAGGAESLDAARSPTGACGPNARHLDMPAWHA